MRTLTLAGLRLSLCRLRVEITGRCVPPFLVFLSPGLGINAMELQPQPRTCALVFSRFVF